MVINVNGYAACVYGSNPTYAVLVAQISGRLRSWRKYLLDENSEVPQRWSLNHL